jgi:hypothetical protein
LRTEATTAPENLVAGNERARRDSNSQPSDP